MTPPVPLRPATSPEAVAVLTRRAEHAEAEAARLHEVCSGFVLSSAQLEDALKAALGRSTRWAIIGWLLGLSLGLWLGSSLLGACS
jgi:hypothetical protein